MTDLDRYLTRGDHDDDVECTGCGLLWDHRGLDERGECDDCRAERLARDVGEEHDSDEFFTAGVTRRGGCLCGACSGCRAIERAEAEAACADNFARLGDAVSLAYRLGAELPHVPMVTTRESAARAADALRNLGRFCMRAGDMTGAGHAATAIGYCRRAAEGLVSK